MICPSCGHSNVDETRFCGYCGYNFSGDRQYAQQGAGQNVLSFKSNRRNYRNAFLIVCAVLIASTFVYLYNFTALFVSTEIYNMGDFKITLPSGLVQQTSDDTYTRYENDYFKFACTKIEGNENALLTNLVSTDTVKDILESRISEGTSYKRLSSTTDSIEFYCNNMYGYARLERYNHNYYIFIVCCAEESKAKYDTAFKKWLGNIEF